MPTEAQDGTYTFDIHVSDGLVTVSQTVRVTVREVNRPPVLTSPGDQTFDELTTLSLTPSATDPDVVAGVPNRLTYSIAGGAQPGMALDLVTGGFTWTPAENQDGTYIVTFRVADDGSPSLADTRTVTLTVREVNTVPVLTPIGDRIVTVGDLLAFTVTASDSDLPANTLALSVTGLPSGATFDPATGQFRWTPTAAQAPGTYSLTFRVSDGSLSAEETIAITVQPAAGGIPVAGLAGPSDGVRGQPRTFTAAATDTAASQPAGFAYAIDWGDGSPVQTIARTQGNGSGVAVEHVFVAAGSYVVKVTATNQAGLASSPVVQTVAVAVMAVQDDPLNPGQRVMVIGGSVGDDKIKVQPKGPDGLKVKLNEKDFDVKLKETFGPPIDRIVVYGQAGDDDLDVAGGIDLPAELYGGAGDDRLKGGGGINLLDGGEGDDVLQGGSGQGLLVGGFGRDLLLGQGGDDLLIGDAFLPSAPQQVRREALRSILAEWTSPRRYEDRVAGLEGFVTARVVDDGVVDILAGGAGDDWFIAGLTTDLVLDAKRKEVLSRPRG